MRDLDEGIREQQRIVDAWTNGHLEYKLHKAQTIIYRLLRSLPKDQREALIFCARRFGKSFLGIIVALEDCLRNSSVQVCIIGPKLKQTRAIVRPIIRRILRDAPHGLVTENKSTSSWATANGSTLILGGFDTILEGQRGLDLYSLYIEETGLATSDLEEYEYLLYSVLFPSLQHARGRVHHLTTPSRVVDHPLHSLTKPRCKLSDAFYSFTIEDNPLLTPEEIEKEIELMGGRESVAVRRELFCEIVRDDSITIVTTFNDARHNVEIEPSHPLYYFVGGDLGYTNDLTAFVLGGYDHNLGKVLVVDEMLFEPGTATSEMVDKLQKWADHKPKYIVDIQGNTRLDMATLGLSASQPIKDKFESTVTFIRNEFYNDRLLIHPRCKLLLESCRSQLFNKQKTDFLRTSVLGHGDALMALVYLLRSIDKQTDLRPQPSIRTHQIYKPANPLAKVFG